MSLISFSRIVTGLELDKSNLGKEGIERYVREVFACMAYDEVVDKIVLDAKPIGPPSGDIEYSTSLVVMTPDELGDYCRAQCESCNLDQIAAETFADDELPRC